MESTDNAKRIKIKKQKIVLIIFRRTPKGARVARDRPHDAPPHAGGKPGVRFLNKHPPPFPILEKGRMGKR